ncbi:MAG: hypothetical protein MUF07_01520 [Steroidobacteraceae bacterium]|jgi:hypothetical protein|nr:hypothetical protein [Steroidobacteraceae bacterium]
MRRVAWSLLLLSVGVALGPPVAHAQLSPEQRCRTIAAGLVLSTKTYRDGGRTRDVALAILRSSDPRDIATPQLRRLLDFGRQRARASTDQRALQRQVYAQCASLDAANREALETEAYLP